MSKLKQTAEMMLCDLLGSGRDSLQYSIAQNPIKVIQLIDRLMAENSYEALVSTHMDTSKVTRVEVIDQNGRSYVNWKDSNVVETMLQDGGRTLKIFITNKSK